MASQSLCKTKGKQQTMGHWGFILTSTEEIFSLITVPVKRGVQSCLINFQNIPSLLAELSIGELQEAVQAQRQRTFWRFSEANEILSRQHFVRVPIPTTPRIAMSRSKSFVTSWNVEGDFILMLCSAKLNRNNVRLWKLFYLRIPP